LYATKQALNACPQAMYLYDNLKEYQKTIEIYDGN
jgi:hypothetical protein